MSREPYEQWLAEHILKLEYRMSDLTDKVDAALGNLQGDANNFKSALAALGASRDLIQSQLTAAQADDDQDKAELQKALDALNAAHAAFTSVVQTAPGGVVTDPVVDGNGSVSVPTSDPTPTPDPVADPTPAEPVEDPTPAAPLGDSVNGDVTPDAGPGVSADGSAVVNSDPDVDPGAAAATPSA